MISATAKALASQRMALIEEHLHASSLPNATNNNAELARQVAALIHEGESLRKPTRGIRPAGAAVAAEVLAGLEWRALQAEVGWSRMRARRVHRIAEVFADWASRPWRVWDLLTGLRRALERRPLPELPEQPSPVSYWKRFEPHLLLEVREEPKQPQRPLPYPHVRVAHGGRPAMFAHVAPHIDLETADVEKELETGFDMVLLEPGVDDRLDGIDDKVAMLRQSGTMVLLVARTRAHLELPVLSHVDLVLAEDPGLVDQASGAGFEVVHIQPSVDETIHNPIGWKQQPQHELMVIADHPDLGADLATLAPLAKQTSLHGSAIPGIEPGHHNPERPVGKDLDQHAKDHRAVYATPQLAATHTSHIQLVLDLTAAGTPVITPPNPTLDELLDGHHLTATNHTELQTHLETLQHPPTRERHSIPARRHVLTHHTRKHRFEQLLTHLDIPTNPTPRVSILLATKRPDHIEHALANVTKQTWNNKELILILHGEINFDLPHIENLTSQLPYPTTILSLPETVIFGDALNQGLDQATGTYITKMDDDDHYGPHHITDLITAHTYSNADITGKWGNIVYLTELDVTVDWQTGREERFGDHIPGATLFGERELIASYRFSRVNRAIDSTLWQRIRSDGGRLFSTHRLNFIRVRHTNHTYRRGDADFVSRAGGYPRSGLDIEGSMV